MTLKAESLLQTPISHTPFPTEAPYKRDELAFAHSFIDEILKWQKLCAKELQQFTVQSTGTNETNASCCCHFEEDENCQCPLKKTLLE